MSHTMRSEFLVGLCFSFRRICQHFVNFNIILLFIVQKYLISVRVTFDLSLILLYFLCRKLRRGDEFFAPVATDDDSSQSQP